jgi:reverse transcriptase-like protein
MARTQASGKLFAPSAEQLRSPEVLKTIFSPNGLRRALKRIAKKDKEDLISHPLKSLVLTEYEGQITDQLVRSVPSGAWSPSGAYVSLTSKRSGAYRELVFPTLIDGIVGRCLIDAIEPLINADDDGKTFSGRSHFSNIREPGDYDDWFRVWQDFTAAIERAAKTEGYAYVFDTDINDFFPSVDRTKAKALIAARTGAHPSLLELLFYCLEAWLPRFSYSPMTGLPVEANDVSRVVAHAYLKSVDAVSKRRTDCIYLRYVDDTVVFCKTFVSAKALRRLHHLELRQLGLNPNAAKSQVMTVEDFQLKRYRDVNLKLERAKKRRDIADVEVAALDWFGLDSETTASWDKVTKLVYSIARQIKAEALRSYAEKHASDVPSVARVALRYLVAFDLTESELRSLLCLSEEDLDMEVAIYLAAAVLDARVDPKWSDLVVTSAFVALHREDDRHGAGFLKGQWLLVIHKYGSRKDRDRLRTLGINFIDDAQWRLHYLYISLAIGALKIADAGTASSLASSDVQLSIRLCGAAMSGKPVA